VPTKKTPAKKAAKVAVKRPATKRPPAAKRATAKGAPGSGVAPRAARIRRQTKEVDVTVVLKLDGRGVSKAETGIPFFDHMLEQLGKHAGFDLEIKAVGDLAVDAHHTVEDTGIAVGEAVQQALGDKAGIARFGAALVPLDEALVQVALDLSARPFLVHEVDAKAKMIGVYDTRLTEEFVRAFCQAAGATIHVRQLAGRQPHHIVEAEFKALARALGDATRPGRTAGVPSTKGTL
jgi:imidazoleglycerol-phosphate dehydratase